MSLIKLHWKLCKLVDHVVSDGRIGIKKNSYKDLQQVEYYALTTDLWSSVGKMESYLTVTIYNTKIGNYNPIV